MVDNWLKYVDELILEKGEKKNGYYKATFTSKELLERAGVIITGPHHKKALTVIQHHYPDSKIEADVYSGYPTWRFNVKVRSK